jgi:hypothetical protein
VKEKNVEIIYKRVGILLNLLKSDIAFFTIRQYVPYNIYYIWHYFQSMFLPFDIMSHSAFIIFNIIFYQRFLLYDVLSRTMFFTIQCFFLSTFCSIHFLFGGLFYRRRFFLLCFVGESM